ncbi:TonB-linked outer membrane protein, SusC/RagA family [Mucilaginibacter lappiensis]|uniref:TonB-linked SusC/RagA family outer membrane protein n=1 Tax=Mucilaginibacter lappiensis TaxID=354630 RepID=A0ABR6PG22_9SPHI|nr:SusC/RagA family TonB-linked outer membrane protein [Mucilaginibacter lappiensis]MBB6108716.1 TonB-linked SusC/RagA family outer membrane protein [Mucilaginibacter lappiensis]SIQ26737.1 TonB-linked outer membrane protein, SusC/RagA family [Mucilaginibacter lappiensis]
MLKNLRSKLRYKSFALIVAITCLLNCALATEIARAQDLDKRISIDVEKKTLKETLDQISKQVHVGIIYSNAKDILKNPVSIHAKDQPVSKVLSELLSPLTLTYEIIGGQIVVKFDNTSSRPPLQEQTEKQRFPIKAKVTDVNGSPLSGATIKIKDGPGLATSDSNGDFQINNIADSTILQISFVGYLTKEIIVTNANYLTISLENGGNQLSEVLVVSTGYQIIPKERATGSFVLIDSALLNRRVSTNILDRLDGVASGVLFNKSLGSGNNPAISIRGRSTIFANPDPLIVLDNFPYDGDLNNINPNDIESVSILKDAAAASIWGTRAGNGVIVITTKKGRTSAGVKISFNANTTFSQRPNLHYQPQMSSADYINLEQFLFNKGYFNNTINDGYSTISPALAVFLQKRNSQITAVDSASKINQLKNNDIRNDLEKYIYRPAVKQQYSFSLSGGNTSNTYYLSAGYDKNLDNTSTNSYDRFTINANDSYFLLNNKLQITAGILLSTSNTKANTEVYTNPLYPYEQLADANNNSLSVVRTGGLRKQFTDTTGSGRLLDWNFRPLDENSSNSKNSLTDYKLNTTAKYKVFDGLEVVLNYQYEKGNSDYTLLHASDSFYTRNMINSYSQVDPVTGVVTRPIPLGAIENVSNSTYTSKYGRAQINYLKKINPKNEVNFLAGVEVKDYQSSANSNVLYGFNPSDDSSLPVDYLTYFPQYYGYVTNTIPYGSQQSYSIDRTKSVFVNASYIYNGKYVLSASARRDESNIFGVKTNQKGVPLWSSGLVWNISKESFYHVELFPVLKMRFTYGYNGNVDKTTSAYLTAQDSGPNTWNTEYTSIVNPPNPSLRWEEDRNINWGLDYVTKSGLLSGSIDYYIKTGIDLIANSPIAPQTGITQFKGNAADTKTTGIDFILTKNSTGNSLLKWQSTLLFSYSKDIITNYKVKQGSNAQIIVGNYLNPVEGYPYNAIFSYPYRGLDNQGKPQGTLNGAVSEDYASILSSNNLSNLVYKGSATPLIYGSFRNSFSYDKFDLSLNLTYKFDYFFRRPNVFSGSNNFGSFGYLAADYDKRWQVPGDELRTNIPALTYPLNDAQNGFFQGSSFLVEKADNIRLQDIRLSYNLRMAKGSPVLKNLQIYAYLNNIGIIWKATKQNIDPDYLYAPYGDPKTLSLGISTHF